MAIVHALRPAALAACLFANAAACAAPTLYHVVALAPLVDGGNGWLGINRKGVVAGYTGATWQEQAVLFHGGTKVTELGTLGGAWSIAEDVNDSGVAVGESENASHVFRAFSWSHGAMTDLGSPPGGTGDNICATAINKGGQIAGWFGISQLSFAHPFFYDAGKLTDLGVLPGGISGFAQGLNDQAHVVGYSVLSNNDSHAFLYRDGALSDLGTLGDATGFSFAYAINNRDQIAGTASASASAEGHAFLWQDGVMKDLGVLPGAQGTQSSARGVNDKGVVVGAATTDAANAVDVAFVDDGKKMVDLNTVLDADSAGWVLTEAIAIGDAGAITGYGTLDGVQQVFLATPVK